MGPPKMSFFAFYMGPPQVSFFAYYMGAPPQVIFFAYCMGAPLMSCFFAYYVGAPLDKLLRILYGGPLRPVSLLTIGGPLISVSSLIKWGVLSSVYSLNFFTIFFFKFLRVKLSLWGPPYFLISRGGQVPPLAPPCGRPCLYVHVQTNFIYNCLHFFSIMYTTRHTYILSLRNIWLSIKR